MIPHADVFYFGSLDDIDQIDDFEDGVDIIHFGDIINFHDIGLTQFGTSVLISAGAGNSVFVSNIVVADLTDADFLFD